MKSYRKINIFIHSPQHSSLIFSEFIYLCKSVTYM